MSRIDNIAKFAQKKEEEQINKEMEKKQKIYYYNERIKSLKPRIDELLAVGNACLEHGIPLTGQAWGGHEGYDTHQFITNSWSHLLGFVANKNLPFTKLGIMGGGACNFDLRTDGEITNVSGDILWVLKKFVDGFDTFEKEFYEYVDKITGQ